MQSGSKMWLDLDVPYLIWSLTLFHTPPGNGTWSSRHKQMYMRWEEKIRLAVED